MIKVAFLNIKGKKRKRENESSVFAITEIAPIGITFPQIITIINSRKQTNKQT